MAVSSVNSFREVIEPGIRAEFDRVDRLIRTPEGRAELAKECRARAARHLRNMEQQDYARWPWPTREDYREWAKRSEAERSDGNSLREDDGQQGHVGSGEMDERWLWFGAGLVVGAAGWGATAMVAWLIL